MSDRAFAVIISVIAAVWGYMVYREIRYGEFRRKGEWGWFRRKDDPGGFAFALVLDSAYLILMLAVLVWLFVGKPKL